MENSPHDFSICIAGIVIRIHTLYTRTFWICQNYLCERNPDFEVTITDQDLVEEQKATYGKSDNFLGGYLEPTAVYRKIIERAIDDFDIMIMHGAAIAVGNEGYIFSGRSGVGKTTHIQKWVDQAPNCYVINGDKPIIRYMNHSFYVCGTPWSGKEHIDTNAIVPLKGIAFMTRDESNSLTLMDFVHAFPRIMNQLYIYKEPYKMQRLLNIVDKMNEQIRFYNFLSNNLKDDSYQVSYDALINSNFS